MAKSGDQYLKELKEYIKDISSIYKGAVGGYLGAVDVFEDNYKKELPLQTLESTQGILEKELKEHNEVVAKAEKFLAELEKALKDKKAVATFGDPKTLADAQKQCDVLSSDLKKAQDVLSKSEGKRKIFVGIISKLKGEVADEKKLVADLEASCKQAENSDRELLANKGIVEGQAEQIEDNYKKFKAGKLPGAGKLMARTLKDLKGSITDLGKEITTAESASSSIDQMIKKLKNAYSAEAKNAIKDSAKPKDALDKRIAEIRKFHAMSLKNVSKYEGYVKEAGG